MLSTVRRCFATGLICAVTLTLAACGGGGGASNTGGVVPAQFQSQVPARNSFLPSGCTGAPVWGLQVSTKAITMASNAPASFTACMQFPGAFTITAAPANQTFLTFPSKVYPTYQNGMYAATISIQAHAPGKVVLTVRSWAGFSARVTVTITAALSLTCPAIGTAGTTTVSCSYTNPGYTGGYNAVGTSSTTCSASAASAGSFTVSDSAAEGCTVTLTPSSGTETAQTATIQFVGPLSLSCPGTGVATGTGVTCTITNANYPSADTYTISKTSGSCSAGTLSGNTFTVTDTVAETNCTIQVAPNSGTEAAVSATMPFVGPMTLTACSPQPAPVGGSGVTCNFSDPGYGGNYNTSSTGTCAVSAATATTVTFTDSTAETCTGTITEASSPGQTVSQKFVFIGPFSVGCDSAASTSGSATCNYSYPGFTGTLATSVDKSCTPSSSAPTPVTGGSFTVTDSTAETCTVTVTPSSGPYAAISQAITFSAPAAVGPLSVNCPSSGYELQYSPCTFNNPNFTGTYTTGTSSSTCSVSSFSGTSSGSFNLSDTASESCTVTLTPSGGEAAGQATIYFAAVSTGGGGVGCSGTRRPEVNVTSNGKKHRFARTC